MRRLPKDEMLALLEQTVSTAGCVMCEVSSGVRDVALRVHHDDIATVVLDRFAAAPGHVLIVLARHVEHVGHLPLEEYLHAQTLAWRACRALESLLAPARTFVASLGSSTPLSTSFPHFHLHVVPLTEQGENARPSKVFSWSEGVWAFDSEAEATELASRLRAAWT